MRQGPIDEAAVSHAPQVWETEYVVLVDADDREIGRAEKLDAHRRGLLHRAFSIIVWDSQGLLLLQKRHGAKYHSGGLWSNACCGHPRPGEETLAAAHRRLREEMRFDCPLVQLGTMCYRADVANGFVEHELVHVYRGLYDGDVRPCPAEAEAFKWVSRDRVHAEMTVSPDLFSVWFRKYVLAGWPMVDRSD